MAGVSRQVASGASEGGERPAARAHAARTAPPRAIIARARHGGISARLALAAVLAATGAASARAAEVEVEIEGVRGELRDNVRATLSIAQADDPSPDRVRVLHARAQEEIARALQPFGYYRPRVESDLVAEGESFTARYVIAAGEPLPVAGVDLQVTGAGAGEEAFQSVLTDFPLRRGAVLVHSRYEEGKQRLVEAAASHGFLDADLLVHEIRVDLAAYTARVRLHFHTGPQYRFGAVTFDPEAMVEESLLRGYVPFREGEPFDLRKLLELQSALSASGYFRRAEVVPHEEQSVDLHVPVHVLLVPARQQRWSFGLGYGPETGARGTVGLDLRRINRRGHRGELDLHGSEIESRFSASYIVPKRRARTDFTTYSLGYSELDSDTSEQRTAVVGAGLDRQRGSWRERLELRWQREDFTIGPDSGTSELLTPLISWRRVEADDVLYPLSGRELRVQVRGAAEGILADASFAQVVGEAQYVRALWGPLRGQVRVTAGYTETPDFRDLPPSIRFFAGGDQSVRGYGFQELGPRDDEGRPLGGAALLTASFELDALFLELEKWGRWGLAVFYDTGDAMTRFDYDELVGGAGAGIRWLSPVGLVRADAAFALDLPGTPLRFHFSLGPDL
jgi:translocation and assembly module TamA